MPQFADARLKRFDWENFARGLALFALGLGKKVLVADPLAPWANAGFAHAQSLSFADGWITMLAYAMQLVFDFSGYTDMALGAALMLNIRLPINFDSPYRSADIQEFWRRWHMTLSRFLRDYVYIPLGGNRGSEARMLRALRGHVRARRLLARRRVDLRDLGHAARRGAGGRCTSGARLGRPLPRAARDRGHVPLRERGAGDLPRAHARRRGSRSSPSVAGLNGFVLALHRARVELDRARAACRRRSSPRA